MLTEWSAIRRIVFSLLLSVLSQSAVAHGGVVQEDDLCVIKVGFLRAHFKVYQPLASGHEQFCEDLPAASESVFVMEYLHASLATMTIDFRIIRDVTGKGRFARLEDVEQIDNLEQATVFYQPAMVEPDVFTVIHDFAEEGDFIGIVSATQPDNQKVYAAVFPFEVGFTGAGYWPFFIGAVVLLQLQYLLMSGRLRRWFRRPSSGVATGLCLVLLLLVPTGNATAEKENLLVSYSTPAGPPEINRMHSWILHVETSDGVPVEGAKLTVTGGMPEHDHGLPTQPRVTEELGGGNYRLEGMRFHMSGYWEIEVTVVTPEGSSLVVIPFQL